MVMFWFIFVFISFSSVLSQETPSKENQDNKEHPLDVDLSKSLATCTYQYSLLAKDEPISFLENLIKPIALEKLLVDILQKQPAVARRSNPNYYGSLLNIDDITTILKNGRKQENPKKKIKYLEEWKLVKRTFSNGEWWTGVYNPNSTITIQEAKEAFGKGGFTLIVKELQGLWSSIHHVAWLLEAALGWRVNVNLYMSPGGSQGFEAHYDWMDGFILQLHGRKNWTIYDPPMAVYPRPDHVRRPSREFFRLAKQEVSSDGDSTSSSSPPPPSFTNVPPQEFILSAGDLVYIPRGIVHEATATTSSVESEERDTSLHLTFGIETATHYSVEIFLHHFIASRSSVIESPPQSSPSPSPSSSFPIDNLSVFIQNDNKNVALFLSESEGVMEDFLHLLLSGVSSYSPPILRSAVGVTVMLIDIPQLNPFHIFPYAVKELLRSLHLPTVLKFLIQRGFIKLSLWDNSNTQERVLFPGSDSSQDFYQSADFTLRYLNVFFSKLFENSNSSQPHRRMISLRLNERDGTDSWLTNLLLNQSSSSNSLEFYNRTALVNLIDGFGNWTEAESQFKEIFKRVFQSDANSLPKLEQSQVEGGEGEGEREGDKKKRGLSNEQKEDEIFCSAWKRMMISVKEEKSLRKKRQVASLKAAGQHLREAKTDPVTPPTNRVSGEDEAGLHIEL